MHYKDSQQTRGHIGIIILPLPGHHHPHYYNNLPLPACIYYINMEKGRQSPHVTRQVLKNSCALQHIHICYHQVRKSKPCNLNTQ